MSPLPIFIEEIVFCSDKQPMNNFSSLFVHQYLTDPLKALLIKGTAVLSG